MITRYHSVQLSHVINVNVNDIKAGQVARGWDPRTAAVAQKLMMISLGIDVDFGLVSDD